MNELEKEALEMLNGNPLPDSIVRWLGECDVAHLEARRKVLLGRMTLYTKWLKEIEKNIKYKRKKKNDSKSKCC